MSKRFLVLIALLMLGFFVAGCADGDKSSSVVNPNPDQFSPVGSISGVVYDACTSVPVKGAVVSVAYAGRVHQVTTSSNGAYSFNNVPAQEMAGDEYDWSGDSYTVSCDLTKVTGYGYAMVNDVSVYYSTLEDGTNDEAADYEGGSGANTPVNNLAATLNFLPGPLTSGLSGTIYDVSTGRAVSGASVSLYYSGKYRASVTSTDGTYSFANIAPGEYSLMVTKAGYDYAALQAPNTVDLALDGYGGAYGGILNPENCNLVTVSCAIGCGQTKASVNVNMIANPAKDKTVPYITSVAAGGETDIIRYDVFTGLDNEDVTSLVFTFSEGMKASRSLKNNAITMESSFVVTLTSAGTSTLNPVTMQASIDIIDSDYTVTMTSAGVMTITCPYISATALKLAVYAADAVKDITAGANLLASTATIGAGSYRVHFENSSGTGNAHLTDLSFNPWTIGTPGELDAYGFLHAFGEAYQDYFILGNGHHFDFAVGDFNFVVP